MTQVYLIHFEKPYKRAQHYLGYTTLQLEERMNRHHSDNGAKLLIAVNSVGIDWSPVRIWKCSSAEEARWLEKKLKSHKKAQNLCPICNPNTAMNCGNVEGIRSRRV